MNARVCVSRIVDRREDRSIANERGGSDGGATRRAAPQRDHSQAA